MGLDFCKFSAVDGLFVAVVSLRQLICFQVGRYVGERISALDRDALGRLVYIFAKAVGF